MTLRQKYGDLAVVAGASEGLGAAFATHLASSGFNLLLIARRLEFLEQFGEKLAGQFHVQVNCVGCDLAAASAVNDLQAILAGRDVHLLVYNAALSFIGPFEDNTIEQHNALIRVNVTAPLNLLQLLSGPMLTSRKGAIVLMSSLAGFQGSGYLAAYAASKAFNRVLAESLWYEWKNRGLDIIACCAGATATPNFFKTNPGKKDFFAPKVQLPEEVVAECFQQLGKRPSFIPGTGNKVAAFIMQRLLPRKMAIQMMGDTTRKMYRL